MLVYTDNTSCNGKISMQCCARYYLEDSTLYLQDTR